MVRNIYPITIEYKYDPAHKGAHFFVNGKYANAGELVEIVLKACKGYRAYKDASTRFDLGSDIEETHTSVKTLGFSLCESIAETWEETIEAYFQRTASTNVSYAVILNESLVEYNMDMDEFKEMLERFGAWDKASKKIRVKRNPLAWLEMRAEA